MAYDNHHEFSSDMTMLNYLLHDFSKLLLKISADVLCQAKYAHDGSLE